MGIISSLIIGALIGWIAGNLFKGRGFGALGNIVVGLVGGVIGSIVFRLIGLSANNIIGEIVCGVVGAFILLAIISSIKKN